jgi:SAM-dependent methyltransferase
MDNPFLNGPARRLNSCLACGNDKLQTYLDLGCQPLANSLILSPLQVQPKYPLEANFCPKCAHSQLSVIIEPSRLFRNYKYVSGTTETLKKHFMALAVDVLNTYEEDNAILIGEEIDVLDIGCNDGTLLEQFSHLGCKVAGMDPAEDLIKLCAQKGIKSYMGYWKESTELDRSFDIITACNVFAHNYNPLGFLRACKKHLAAGGLVIIEMPYSLNTLKENQGDQFYHEHINYFNVSSFGVLAARAGLFIRKVLRTPIHGGSIRFYLKEGIPGHCEEALGMLDAEYEAGLFRIDTYVEFAGRFYKNMEEFFSLLEKHREELIGYAASAKSAVVLNYMYNRFGYLPRFRFFVDDNNYKQGWYLPGTSILIKHPKVLNAVSDRALIACFAWNFMSEIRSRIPKDIAVATYVPRVYTSK